MDDANDAVAKLAEWRDDHPASVSHLMIMDHGSGGGIGLGSDDIIWVKNINDVIVDTTPGFTAALVSELIAWKDQGLQSVTLWQCGVASNDAGNALCQYLADASGVTVYAFDKDILTDSFHLYWIKRGGERKTFQPATP